MMGLFFLPMWYVPYLQQQYPEIQMEEAVGYFGKTKKPNFYGKRWMSGEFQQNYESFVRAKNPLHGTAIRIKSQLDYSIYGDIMHANILSGKNGFLFQKEGCEAFIGRDYKGINWIKERIEKLSIVANELKKDSVEILVLMPLLKARVYSENLPDFYQNNQSDSTNWDIFPKLLREKGIEVLDFSFLQNNTFTHPIYPPSGQHWTKYGAALASEKIKEQIENQLKISMVEMKWRDSIEFRIECV